MLVTSLAMVFAVAAISIQAAAAAKRAISDPNAAIDGAARYASTRPAIVAASSHGENLSCA